MGAGLGSLAARHQEGQRRMLGADHWPRVQVFWGLHPEGWRARVPHVGTWHGFRARPTGARLAVPGVPVGGLGGGQPGHICRPSRGRVQARAA